ncbi:MAG: type IV toxin-antitoxin system AbiEi family antitoxin [Tepidisphaeraceae bacterium]|jgi:predicted transcriptional regulator of viral defense system
MAGKTLENWIDAQQARGRYTFLRAEAIAGSGLSAEAVKKALQRLVERHRVVKVKDYFYVVVALEYRNADGPPPSWFIHDLMAAMKLPYYVGLLSAAALHGASHQQPQEFQVVTDRSVRPLKVGRARIRFFASKSIAQTPTVNMKTPTGSVRVSTPEITAVDLMRFVKAAGQLDNVATVIAELVPLIHPKRLLEAIRQSGHVPSAQRLGYVLDHLKARSVANVLHEWVKRQSRGTVALRLGRIMNGAKEDRRWHVLVDEPLEVEA